MIDSIFFLYCTTDNNINPAELKWLDLWKFSVSDIFESIFKKSRNSDTLSPVELIVWPEQGNQGDQREQDDQGEVSIIIFGMSKSSGFQKYSIC